MKEGDGGKGKTDPQGKDVLEDEKGGCRTRRHSSLPDHTRLVVQLRSGFKVKF